MAILVRCRIHTAVYWRAKGPDGRGGNVYEAPVEIACRWDQDEENIVRTVSGDTYTCMDSVICDRKVNNGDRMLLGTLASIPAALIHRPEEIKECKVVRRVSVTTKLRNADRTDMSKTLVLAILS